MSLTKPFVTLWEIFNYGHGHAQAFKKSLAFVINCTFGMNKCFSVLPSFNLLVEFSVRLTFDEIVHLFVISLEKLLN